MLSRFCRELLSNNHFQNIETITNKIKNVSGFCLRAPVILHINEWPGCCYDLYLQYHTLELYCYIQDFPVLCCVSCDSI